MDRWFHHIVVSQHFRNALEALIEVMRRYWLQRKLTLTNLAELEWATLLVLCTIELWLLAIIFIYKLAGILSLITAACILKPNFSLRFWLWVTFIDYDNFALNSLGQLLSIQYFIVVVDEVEGWQGWLTNLSFKIFQSLVSKIWVTFLIPRWIGLSLGNQLWSQLNIRLLLVHVLLFNRGWRSLYDRGFRGFIGFSQTSSKRLR